MLPTCPTAACGSPCSAPPRPSRPTSTSSTSGPDGAPAGARRRRVASTRKLTALNAEALADVRLLEPEERWETVDGRRIQGWLIRAADATGPAPLVLEIHGGPHTLYGWAPGFEFQVLAGAGMSVLYTNPRGSEGYGQEFNAANLPDWGDGPMADVLAHVDAAGGRRDGRPRPARGDGRLVRRLPDELDRRPRPSASPPP